MAFSVLSLKSTSLKTPFQDCGRFRDRDFGRQGDSRDNDERHHRHFFNDFDFVAFGFPYWWYPDHGYVDYGYSDEDADNDSAPAYGDQYWQDLAMKVQWALSRRGYYDGPIDGQHQPRRPPSRA